MGGYVFTIDQRFPEHWDIAKENHFWDITRMCGVQPGDTLLFWQTGNGCHLLGLAEATTSADALRGNTKLPWSAGDPRRYEYRVRFSLLSEAPRAKLSWSDIQRNIASGGFANNGTVMFRAPEAEKELRRLYGVPT